MPTLTTTAQLLAALGDVIDTVDPIDALKARGFTFAAELARRIDAPQVHARLRTGSSGRPSQRCRRLRRSSRRTTHQAIAEPRPDLYFLFQVTNQPVVDSRTQPGGFALNVATKHWGTADTPLLFRVPRPGPVILG